MKKREEFLQEIYDKAERRREEESACRRKRTVFRLAGAAVGLLLCVAAGSFLYPSLHPAEEQAQPAPIDSRAVMPFCMEQEWEVRAEVTEVREEDGKVLTGLKAEDGLFLEGYYLRDEPAEGAELLCAGAEVNVVLQETEEGVRIIRVE